MPAAAPPPPPRRTRRACVYALHLGEAFACADSGRFGVRPVGVALGGTALPIVVRDGLVGAADEQRHDGFGEAAGRRNVQRRAPAGRRRRNRHSRRPTTPPDGPRGRAHPVPFLHLVFRSARATTSCSMIAGYCSAHVTFMRVAAAIKAVNPNLRTAGHCGGGEPRSAAPLALGTRSNPTQQVWLAVPGGSRRGFVFLKLRRCRLKRDSSECWHTLSVLAYRPPPVPPSKGATTAG
jgi:hypothetical protein